MKRAKVWSTKPCPECDGQGYFPQWNEPCNECMDGLVEVMAYPPRYFRDFTLVPVIEDVLISLSRVRRATRGLYPDSWYAQQRYAVLRARAMKPVKLPADSRLERAVNYDCAAAIRHYKVTQQLLASAFPQLMEKVA